MLVILHPFEKNAIPANVLVHKSFNLETSVSSLGTGDVYIQDLVNHMFLDISPYTYLITLVSESHYLIMLVR